MLEIPRTLVTSKAKDSVSCHWLTCARLVTHMFLIAAKTNNN